jgi:hypothetical protein
MCLEEIHQGLYGDIKGATAHFREIKRPGYNVGYRSRGAREEAFVVDYCYEGIRFIAIQKPTDPFHFFKGLADHVIGLSSGSMQYGDSAKGPHGKACTGHLPKLSVKGHAFGHGYQTAKSNPQAEHTGAFQKSPSIQPLAVFALPKHVLLLHSYAAAVSVSLL